MVHKIVDQTICDKTTQCIILLTASRLSNPKLPSALNKKIEMSRVGLSGNTRNRLALHGTFSLPNVHLFLRVLVLE